MVGSSLEGEMKREVMGFGAEDWTGGMLRLPQ